MKKCGVVIFLLLPFFTQAQIVTTFAGGATSGLGDGGPATAASIADPATVAFDKTGSCYIASAYGGNRIRKIDTSGIITTFAGNGTAGYSGDGGPATAAELSYPQGTTLDTFGNLYISDAGNNAIRKVNAATGIISTIAGTGTAGYNGDGIAATSAMLNDPQEICFDRFGNLYIADYENNRVRKINTSGIITTFAGNGVYGFSGDNGPATAAQLWVPGGVACDDTGLYISDRGNFRIRKVDKAGIISTFAGNGNETYIGDGIQAINAQFAPDFINFNSLGELFIGDDDYNYRVLMVDNSGIIHSVAGNGIAGYSGDGGSADSAEFYYPAGAFFDHCNNAYIPDIKANRVRKVSFNPSCWPESIQNTTATNTINLYPNPAYNLLNIDNLKTQANYRLLSIVGAVMQQGILQEGSNSIPINSLPSGMYMVEVTGEQGIRTVNKIIKQ